MALSFRRNGDATFSITVPMQERRLLEALIPQVRELITEHDMLAWRLFPNPYPHHEKAADEYATMIGDELVEKHLAALETVESTLDSKRIEEEQMVAWMHAINQLRLVIGTRLKVTEESQLEDFDDDDDRSLFVTFAYLGQMLYEIVDALGTE